MRPACEPSQSAGKAVKDRPSKIRIMIVDDSLVVRSALRRAIEEESDLEILVTASTGEQALDQLRRVAVDVILLDLEMPGMGGLEALPLILKAACGAQVLVVSSLTSIGAEATLTALSMGAADTLLKPQVGGFDNEYRRALVARIRALGGGNSAESACGKVQPVTPPPSLKARVAAHKRPRLVAIGASTGGIHALCRLLGQLPRSFTLPIAVTQHLPATFLSVFARQLELASARPAHVAEEGAILRQGEIMIAPGHGHLMFEERGETIVARIADFPTPSGCRPSVDPMFDSIARKLGGQAIAVVLSGMGRDGAIGAAELSEAGGTIFAQDQETSAVWGMPRAVATAGIASAVLPPEELAVRIAAGAAG